MKSFSAFALMFLALFFTVTAASASTPEERELPIDHIFVPAGFDSNDTVEIVITGFLPNLCHKSPAAKVEVKEKEISVKMTSLYYHDTNPLCPEMVVPFVETVSLGLLDSGSYEIIVNGGGEFERKENILIQATSSSAVDDFNYAYVEYVEKELEGKQIALKGYHFSDCFVLDKIDHFSNKKDTYSILPKLKQVRDFCPMKMTPFIYKFKVPTELKAEKILLHVRTLSGKSFNTIYLNE